MNRYLLLILLAVVVPVLARASDRDLRGSKSESERFQTVRDAERFTIGGVGYAGVPSREETAFRQIIKQHGASVLCQKLLTEATPAGQLYGLLGLRILDEQAFKAALPRYKKSKMVVLTMSGCIGFPTSAGELVHKIETGKMK